MEDEEQISIIEPTAKNYKKDLILKNIKSDYTSSQGATAYQVVQKNL